VSATRYSWVPYVAGWVAEQGAPFTADDVWAEVARVGLPVPGAERRELGNVLRGAVRSGRIRHTGGYVRGAGHGRPLAVWEPASVAHATGPTVEARLLRELDAALRACVLGCGFVAVSRTGMIRHLQASHGLQRARP
jgi:hypothetical protein